MPLYRDEGVVLRTVKLGEADRIITLLTRNHGKVRAVAKGVRRVKSRFGARLEPFMRVDVLVATGRSLDVVSQAESIAAYAAPICADYASYEAANIIVETVDKLIATQNEQVDAQYRLLIGALNALAKHAHPAVTISESYVLRALALAGWTPRLRSCVVCGRALLATEPIFASVSSGGVMCATDRTTDAQRLSEGERLRLIAAVEGDWTVLDQADSGVKIRSFVEEWAEYYLERPIRSLRLLD